MKIKMQFFICGLVLFLSCLACAQDAEKKFDVDEIKRLVLKHDLRKIDELLPYLPESLRSHFTLKHFSESSQKAKPEAPRAILFGEDAELIVAFNGDPKLRGFNSFEMIQFKKGQFEFHEIVFPKNPKDGKAEISKANPNRCLDCHGTPPRPIWDSYFTWPGTYGSVDDGIMKETEEGKNFLNFAAKGPSHARYKHLKFPDSKSNPFSPYYESHSTRTGVEVDKTANNRILKFTPNTRFSMLLSRLSARTIANELANLPEFKKYGAYYLYHQLACRITKLKNEHYEAMKKLDEHLVDPSITDTKKREWAANVQLGKIFDADSKGGANGPSALSYFDGIKSTRHYVNGWFANAVSQNNPGMKELLATQLHGLESKLKEYSNLMTKEEAQKLDASGIAWDITFPEDKAEMEKFMENKKKLCLLIGDAIVKAVKNATEKELEANQHQPNSTGGKSH